MGKVGWYSFCQRETFKENELISDIFVPFQASIRNHLGELADEWLNARRVLIRRVSEQIAVEHDVTKLAELQKMLREALVSDADVSHVDAMTTKLVGIGQKTFRDLLEIAKTSAEIDKVEMGKGPGHH